MSQQNQSLTVTNLGTTTLNITNTDTYTVAVTLQLPTMSATAIPGAGGGAGTGTGGSIGSSTQRVTSQVVTTVKQNGSTIATSSAGAKGLTVPGIACTAGDTIAIQLSSSLAQDQQENAIQATIALSEGPN
jgi:hypothetical protein